MRQDVLLLDTPKQNGTTESLNKVILAKARAILINSGLLYDRSLGICHGLKLGVRACLYCAINEVSMLRKEEEELLEALKSLDSSGPQRLGSYT